MTGGLYDTQQNFTPPTLEDPDCLWMRTYLTAAKNIATLTAVIAYGSHTHSDHTVC
jgi:hypothetical protein